MKWLLQLLGVHYHEWGIWHREGGALIVTCYECGKTREVKARLEVV